MKKENIIDCYVESKMLIDFTLDTHSLILS